MDRKEREQLNRVRVQEVLTFAALKALASAQPLTIYYSANTCWWTHRPEDLDTHSAPSGLPLDPRGSPLLMTGEGDALAFLETADYHQQRYGVFGLRTFMAAHHMNALHFSENNPWAAESWKHYELALSALDASKSQ